MPYALTFRIEAAKCFDTLSKHCKMMSHSPKSGQKPTSLVDFKDAVALVDASGDAMIARFPTLPPAVAAKMPQFGQRDSDYYPMLNVAHTTIIEVSKLVRTDADVDAFLDALDRLLDKAVKSPDLPREIVANLAKMVGRYHDLELRGPRAVSESNVAAPALQ